MQCQTGRQGRKDRLLEEGKNNKGGEPEDGTGRKGREEGEGGSRRAAAHAKGWQGQQGATVSSNGCRRP